MNEWKKRHMVSLTFSIHKAPSKDGFPTSLKAAPLLKQSSNGLPTGV